MSVGTATMAMILNGLGFSNRQLYLVPQFFVTQPAQHLLGPGTAADMPHDVCLGRALDWLHARDPMALFAGIAHHADVLPMPGLLLVEPAGAPHLATDLRHDPLPGERVNGGA